MAMMDAVLAAGKRLAEALSAENEALESLDLARAAGLADTKIRASDAFAAATAAAAKAGARVGEGPARRTAEDLALRLQALSEENHRLLERAIRVQSQVIETIAAAAAARATAPGYGAAGRRLAMRQPQPMALATRA